MPAGDPGLLFKDYVALIASGTSLLVTIGWNWANRRHTDQVAKEIRAETYDLDSWKNCRSEIMRTLRDLETAGRRLSVLSNGAHSKDDLLREFAKGNLTLVEAHMSLVRELDRPAFTPSWLPLAYGAYIDGESEWDRLNAVLGEINEDVEDVRRLRQALGAIDGYIERIAAPINERVTERDRLLHPNNA